MDWDRLAEMGFDVYRRDGLYIAAVAVHSMEEFADCVYRVCPKEVIADTVFRFATYAELGWPTNHQDQPEGVTDGEVG